MTTSSISNATEPRASISLGRLFRALFTAMLVLAPYGYFGILLAVAVHEVIGHGLVSLAVGGQFLGFQLDFDGMGYAFVPLQGGGGWREILVLAAGVAATSVIGLGLFLCGYMSRYRPWIALPMLVVSFGLLMDGIPYAFWNALRPVPPGDLGRIIAITNSPSLRTALMVLGGASMVAVVWAFTALIFAILQSWIAGGGRLQGKTRVLLLLLLGVIPGMAWFTFDWNQLVPGIGATPNITGAVLHVIAAGSLLWIKPHMSQIRSVQGTGVAALVGWSLAALSITAIVIWLRHGVFFFA